MSRHEAARQTRMAGPARSECYETLELFVLAIVVVCMSGADGLRVRPVDAATSAAPTISIRRNSALNFDVFTGDMNGDGIIDADATDPYASSGTAIVVALGNGDSTFKAPIRSATFDHILIEQPQLNEAIAALSLD